MNDLLADFVKVFDIAESGYRTWGFPANGLIFVAVGLYLIYSEKLIRKLGWVKSTQEKRSKKKFGYSSLGFSLLWITISFFFTYSEYRFLKSATCATVQGPVENFEPMTRRGNERESYTVGGIRFSYSDFSVTNGFNNTASHGGPVNASSTVQICYVHRKKENIIVRLWVKGYIGPLKDYSGGYFFFDFFKEIEKGRMDKKRPLSGPGFDKAGDISRKFSPYLTAVIILDFILYASMYLPFLSLFPRIEELEHDPFPLGREVLSGEKETLANLTVKFDGEKILWARPYGLDLLKYYGFALKMTLSRTKDQVVKSEVVFSPLVLMELLGFAVLGIFFFEVVTDQFKDGLMKLFPYIFFPMIAFGLWIGRGRFVKLVNQFFKETAGSYDWSK